MFMDSWEGAVGQGVFKRAVACRAVSCRAVPCRAVPFSAVLCRVVPCRAVLCCVNSRGLVCVGKYWVGIRSKSGGTRITCLLSMRCKC